jgi:hypothetical protein
MFTITDKTKIMNFYGTCFRVEKEMQTFLKENIGVTILKILQSESSNIDNFDFSITIFYEEK